MKPACDSCGLKLKQFLAVCNDCGQSFCNQYKGDKNPRSHIYLHMKKYKHVSFTFPNSKFPSPLQCQFCGCSNILKLYYRVHVLNDEIVVTCADDECIEQLSGDYKGSAGLPLFDQTNKRVNYQLLPIPGEKVLKQSEIDIKDDNTGDAYDISKDNLRKQINQNIIQETETLDYQERLDNIKLKAEVSIVIPNRFNTKLKDLRLLNGQFAVTQNLNKGDYEFVDQMIKGKNRQIQKQIDKRSELVLNYEDAFRNIMLLEYEYQQIVSKQSKFQIATNKMYYRSQPGRHEIVIVGLNRYQVVLGKQLQTQDNIQLTVQMSNQSSTNFYTTVQQTKDNLVLKVNVLKNELDIDECEDFKKIHSASEDRKMQLTDAKGELGTSELFRGYDVWRPDSDDMIIWLTTPENIVLKRRVLESLKKFQATSCALYDVLKGVSKQQRLDLEVEEMSKELLPETNVNQIMNDLLLHLKSYKDQGQAIQAAPNEAQAQAIRECLTKALCLVQGCPGSGKTTLISYVVWCLRKMYADSQNRKIFCCAGSNIAADNMILHFKRIGIKALRVYSQLLQDNFKEYDSPKEIQEYSLNNVIQSILQDKNNEITQQFGERKTDALLKLYQLGQELFIEWYNSQGKLFQEALPLETLKEVQTWIEKRVIEDADIIVCTCATSGDQRLAGVKAQVVLLDESSQALEPEQIIALLHTQTHVLLFGDKYQLGPNIQCVDLKRSKIERPLFERLLQNGLPSSLLNIQYRSHPALIEFSNAQFYANAIKSPPLLNLRMGLTSYGGGNHDDNMDLEGNYGTLSSFFDPSFPSMFIHIDGVETQEGTSYKNTREVDLVLELLEQIRHDFEGITKDKVGIITPYVQQQVELQRMQSEENLVETNSVDAFQGREKDVIIISCVRSNHAGNVGFLRNKQRLNVSLTRARRFLVIVGNVQTLSKCTIWKQLVAHYARHNQLYTSVSNKMIAKAKIKDLLDDKQ